MSFSKEVKENLSKLNNLANKEEVLYEFFGYLLSGNTTEEKDKIKYLTENDYNIDRYAKLLKNLNIEDFKISVNGKLFCIEFKKSKINDVLMEKINKFENKINNFSVENNSDIKANIENAKAFVRGIFMGAGSINNPEKKYHLETGCKNCKIAEYILEILKINNINVKQKEKTIYIKDGEEISKFLAFIGATISVLKFEEIRVQRNMNNKVNRLVNCETANLNKTINASVEQINAIRKLKQNGKFEKLDSNLKEIAELRLENPDMPLSELGKLLSNPVGKSGVNYRLRKIVQIADLNS